MNSGGPKATRSPLSAELIRTILAIKPRQVILGTLIVLLVGLGFYLLIYYQQIVFGLFVAVVFSTGLRPAVEWLARRGIPRPVAAVFLFAIILAALVAILVLMIPLFTDQGDAMMRTLTGYYSSFRSSLLNSPSDIVSHLARRLPISLQFLGNIQGVEGTEVDQVATATTYARDLIWAILMLLMELILIFFLIIDRDSILLFNLSFVPTARRQQAREFVESIEHMVSDFLRGQALLSLSIFILSLIAYLLIGLPNAIVLALFAGLMEAIPLIGPFIGAIPALLLVMTVAPQKVIWVVVATVIVQQLENHILVPRIMQKSVGVSPVVTLLAFVFFSSLFGLVGGLLAVPLATTLMLVIERLRSDAKDKADQEALTGRDELDVLHYETLDLLDDMRGNVRDKESEADATSDALDNEIESIASDLDELIQDINQRTIQRQA